MAELTRMAPNEVPPYATNVAMGGTPSAAQVLGAVMDAWISSHFEPVESLMNHMTSSSGIRDDGFRADMTIGINGKRYKIIAIEERER